MKILANRAARSPDYLQLYIFKSGYSDNHLTDMSPMVAKTRILIGYTVSQLAFAKNWNRGYYNASSLSRRVLGTKDNIKSKRTLCLNSRERSLNFLVVIIYHSLEVFIFL